MRYMDEKKVIGMGLAEKEVLEEIRKKELEIKKLEGALREIEQKKLEKEKMELIRQRGEENKNTQDDPIKRKLNEMHREAIEREKKRQKSDQPKPYENKHFDHPNTMENDLATVLYVIVMVGGVIFNDRWLIWIAATIIYFRHITRHDR